MTVRELKEMLKDVDDERIVVMSSDSEGNSFSMLAVLDDESVYNTRSGECGIGKLTPELKKDGYTQEDIIRGKKALVLWPID